MTDEKKPQTREELLTEVFRELSLTIGLNALRTEEAKAGTERIIARVTRARDKLDAALRSELRSATHEEMLHLVLDYAQQTETVSEGLAKHVADLVPKLMEHEVFASAVRAQQERAADRPDTSWLRIVRTECREEPSYTLGQPNSFVTVREYEGWIGPDSNFSALSWWLRANEPRKDLLRIETTRQMARTYAGREPTDNVSCTIRTTLDLGPA